MVRAGRTRLRSSDTVTNSSSSSSKGTTKEVTIKDTTKGMTKGMVDNSREVVVVVITKGLAARTKEGAATLAVATVAVVADTVNAAAVMMEETLEIKVGNSMAGNRQGITIPVPVDGRTQDQHLPLDLRQRSRRKRRRRERRARRLM